MAIVKEMTGRNRAAQLEIVKQMSRQESRSSAGPDHVTEHALITWLSCTDDVTAHALMTWLIGH